MEFFHADDGAPKKIKAMTLSKTKIAARKIVIVPIIFMDSIK